MKTASARYQAERRKSLSKRVEQQQAEIVKLRQTLLDAANMADEADLNDQNSNGAAASGGAYGLGDRIRELIVKTRH